MIHVMSSKNKRKNEIEMSSVLQENEEAKKQKDQEHNQDKYIMKPQQEKLIPKD